MFKFFVYKLEYMTKEKTQRDDKIRLEEGSLLETDVVQMLCQKKSQTSSDEREKSSSSTNTSSWIDDYFAASVCLSQMPHAQDSSYSSYYMCFCLHYLKRNEREDVTLSSLRYSASTGPGKRLN